jgi:hypothetical protein
VDNTLDEDAKFHTHLDLASMLWKVPVRAEDIHKTTFQAHDGSMEWVGMPFGLCNAPYTFHRMINDILGATFYLDDVCVYTRTLEKHLEHMRLVLQRVKDEGLKLHLTKHFYGLHEMHSGYYIVPVCKIYVSTKKVEAVANIYVPTTRKEVHSFVQFCNFYSMFIRRFCDLTAPLTDLLRKS